MAEHEARYREDAVGVDLYTGWHLVTVADGGSAFKLSRVGANTAVRAALAGMRSRIRTHERRTLTSTAIQNALTEDVMQGMQRAYDAIEEEAAARELPIEELSTTLLLLAHRELARDTHLVAAVQVGGGIMIARDGTQQLRWLGSPDIGSSGDDTLFLSCRMSARPSGGSAFMSAYPKEVATCSS